VAQLVECCTCDQQVLGSNHALSIALFFPVDILTRVDGVDYMLYINTLEINTEPLVGG